MSTTTEDELARAREDKREKAVVARRLADTRADRTRVMQQLEVTKQLLDSEQDDVDRLTKGVGGFFRKLAASREDLTREQKELEAAKLQHDALVEELQAIEFDLAGLCEREAKVVDADQRYAAALAVRERQARELGSPASSQLAALADQEAALRGLRKEVGEAIDAGRAAHDLLAMLQQAATSNQTAAHGIHLGAALGGGFSIGIGNNLGGLGSQLVGDVGSGLVRDALRRDLGHAQHALLRFQRECRDVSPDSGVPGVTLTPLPGLGALIAREMVWTNHTIVDDIHAEVSLIASHVAQSVMELRGRDAQLERALAETSEQRASLLDPVRDRL